MKRITSALIFAIALAAPMLALPVAGSAQASVGISVAVGPPLLPYYPQPDIPGPGYIWAPGYWGYGPFGYYWVPGTWVFAPAVGLLWTPGYWGWRGGVYWWHPGYWGTHVGYYGGIYYGYGYAGVGYAGGYWRGNVFYYNRAVNNINTTVIHNTYNQPVTNDNNFNHVSYNGGAAGVVLQPTHEQEVYASEQHYPATATQLKHEHTALEKPGQRYSVNNGRPGIAATTYPGKFGNTGVVRMNKTQDSYVYRPDAHNAARTYPIPSKGAYPGQAEVNGQPHAQPPEHKHPPEHKKNEEGRPPPR